ncbi:hypothetical protein BDR07DRAFT_1391819 [Suillus spraguei]|nr:hypothetical protein BDR07DRAFT_1391819 [Suillus spraguei]
MVSDVHTPLRIMSFFLHITIIHEVSHVVMLVFSSEPTPTNFHGYRSLKNNPAGFNHEGLIRSREGRQYNAPKGTSINCAIRHQARNTQPQVRDTQPQI